MDCENFNRRAWFGADRVRTAAFSVAFFLCCSAIFALTAIYYSRMSDAFDMTLPCRINPNDADLATLVLLPGIGPSRAEAIIEYRRSGSAGQSVFNSPADLLKIKGIGPKTLEKLIPYLSFEQAQIQELSHAPGDL